MHPPEPNPANDREQCKQRKRQSAKSTLERGEWLPWPRRLDPVIVASLHAFDSVSQTGKERQEQHQRGSEREPNLPRCRGSRLVVALRVEEMQIDQPQRLGH